VLVVPERIRTLPAAVAGRGALAGIAAAAWVALAIGIAGHTAHDDVVGQGRLPHASAVAALIGGWLIMIAAMMLPPELIMAVRTRAAARVVVATTCAVWTGFAIVALSGDAVVHALADSRPWLARAVTPAVLIGAGLFQLSPAKRRLLAATRRPSGRSWRHGLRCLGSCWALMLVMFAVGAGNLIWMVVLTAVMTAERAGPSGVTRGAGALTGALAGFGLIAVGVLVAVQPDRIA